jgi:RNA polymerase sigma-70 factor (ECF subfamily)
MMGVCLWYSKNREEAEEILQDGFLRIFRYIKKYRREGSFEGWIKRIMINVALSKFSNKLHLKPMLSYGPELPEIPYDPSAFNHLDEKELLQLIQKLTPVYRMVFNLHELEGMKHKEIAVLLGISEGTSKSNLSDARSALQKMVKLQSGEYLSKSRQL